MQGRLSTGKHVSVFFVCLKDAKARGCMLQLRSFCLATLFSYSMYVHVEILKFERHPCSLITCSSLKHQALPSSTFLTLFIVVPEGMKCDTRHGEVQKVWHQSNIQLLAILILMIEQLYHQFPVMVANRSVAFLINQVAVDTVRIANFSMSAMQSVCLRATTLLLNTILSAMYDPLELQNKATEIASRNGVTPFPSIEIEHSH